MISRSVCIEKFTFNICFIEKRSDSLSLDSDELAESVKRISARVLVLDPIQSFLGENINMNRANVIRPRLNQKTGCAVLLVGHLNKNSSGKANYRGLGSVRPLKSTRSLSKSIWPRGIFQPECYYLISLIRKRGTERTW